MQDGSDAVSDWPLLNALLNTASGATWVSIHHGGGVGMGYSQHAGVVIVCDGSDAAASRIRRVLWNDPGTGVMRHADAGYEIAIDCAREQGLNLPMIEPERRPACDRHARTARRRADAADAARHLRAAGGPAARRPQDRGRIAVASALVDKIIVDRRCGLRHQYGLRPARADPHTDASSSSSCSATSCSRTRRASAMRCRMRWCG